MTWRYLNCPSGPVIRMLCVITMSTMEGVKTQLVHKGQASNTLEDLRFSLWGSWTYNLSTLAEFMSHWPMENINQSLPEAHHSMAANLVCKHFIFLDYSLKEKLSCFSLSINNFVKADKTEFIWTLSTLQSPTNLYKTGSLYRGFFANILIFWIHQVIQISEDNWNIILSTAYIHDNSNNSILVM